MRALFKLPFHILALATQAKSFRDNPVIGNRGLNRLGLHVLRVMLAHGAMALRRGLLAWRLSAEDRRSFDRDGYLVKRDFLPPELFAALEQEARALAAAGRGADSIQGDTLTRQFLIDEACLRAYPAIRAATEGGAFRRHLGYVAGRMRVPFRWVQIIRSGQYPGAEPDPQRVLHLDTFQPNMKAWLFITDADARKGPFTYVPGSHRLSRARLRWEYRQSLIGRDQPTVYAARGSLRIEESELPALGLPPPRALACPRNTLIVADTCGFHRRGEAQDDRAERIEIWAISRTNPFNPLPGLPFRALDRMERRVYPKFDQLRQWMRSRRRG